MLLVNTKTNTWELQEFQLLRQNYEEEKRIHKLVFCFFITRKETCLNFEFGRTLFVLHYACIGRLYQTLFKLDLAKIKYLLI